MKLVVYMDTVKGPGERLMQMAISQIPNTAIEFYGEIDLFSRRLFELGYGGAIGVLLATSTTALMEIFAVKDFISDIRKVLILPDSELDTISLGLKLYPRFFSYADSDFEDVAAVLRKMTGKTKLENIETEKVPKPLDEVKPIGNYLRLMAA